MPAFWAQRDKAAAEGFVSPAANLEFRRVELNSMKLRCLKHRR